LCGLAIAFLFASSIPVLISFNMLASPLPFMISETVVAALPARRHSTMAGSDNWSVGKPVWSSITVYDVCNTSS